MERDFCLGHDVEFVFLRLVRGVVLFLEKKLSIQERDNWRLGQVMSEGAPGNVVC
jgi:hypothetical protein